MGPAVGEAHVDLSLNDRGLMTELSAAEARVKRTMDRISHMRAEAEIRADLSDLDRKMKKAEASLDRWRGKKAEAKLDVDTAKAEAQIKRFETQLDRLKAKHVDVTVELHTRRDAEDYLMRLARRVRGVNDETSRANTSLGRWISSVTQMTLRLGPFTAKVSQFARALLLLGPVVTGLVGALGALVGVLGSGTIGAFGLGSAAVAGFALNVAGLGFALKPIGNELKKVQQASNTYQQSVLRYGAGSKQAASAQEKLNNTLKGVSPAARAAFKDLGTLQSRWNSLTQPTRTAALDVMGQGLKTLKDLMPQLSDRTNQFAKILDTQLSGALERLRGPGGRNVIDQIMGGFNRSLPGLLGGVEHLAAAWGKFTAAFARPTALGLIARSFNDWASGVDRAASKTARINQIADHTAHAFMDIVHFGSAATRVLASFFGAGAGQGANLLEKMTAGLNHLADTMNTAAGQKKLHQFFSQSVQDTQLLWNALRPLLGLFVNFSRIMQPFAAAALHIADALASIAHAAAGLGPVGAILKGIFGYELVRSLPVISRFLPSIGKIFGGIAAAAGLKGLAGKGGGLLPRLIGKAAPAAVKAEGVTAGEALGAGLTAGASAALGVAGAALIGSGVLTALILGNHGASGFAQQAAQQAGVGGGQVGKAYKDAFDKYMLSHGNPRTAVGNYDQIVAGAKAAAEKAAAQVSQGLAKGMTQGIGKGIQAVNSAMANIRAGENLNKLQASQKGAALVMKIQLSGDKEAQATLARLAATKIGTKFLKVIAQGGDQALRQLLVLAHTQLGQKILSIIETGGPHAQQLLDALENKKLRAKIVSIIQRGGSEAQALLSLLDRKRISNKNFAVLLRDIATGKIQQIVAKRIPDKLFSVIAHDGASGVISRVIGMLGSIPRSIVTTVTTVARRIAAGVQHAAGRAEGGPASPDEKMAMGALASAVTGPIGRATGQRVARPMLLVGEENRDEYVIATNPAYRERNVGFLAQAAHEFGLSLIGPNGLMIAARRGKGKQVTGKKGHTYHVPQAVKYGVSEDQAQHAYDTAHKHFDHIKSQLQSEQHKSKPDHAKIEHLQKEMRRAQADMRKKHADWMAVHRLASRVADLNTRIETDRKRMDRAAKEDNPAAFDAARTDRLNLLGTLRGILNKADRYAKGAYKHKVENDLEDVLADIDETTNSGFSPSMTLEDFLGATGQLGTYQNLQLAIAKARLTADGADDAAANSALRNFLTGILNTPGLAAPIATEVANDLADLMGGGTGGGLTADQQAQLDQAQTIISLAQQGKSIFDAYNSVANGSGDIGTGRFNSASAAGASGSNLATQPTIVINTLHPGDPTTLRAIGDAAAAGFTFQGLRRSSRRSLGY